LWLHSLKVAQLLRSAACLHTNQSRSYLNHLVLNFSLMISSFVAVWMRPSLFQDVTQRRFVVIYRLFATTYRFHLHETSSPEPWRWDGKVVPKRLYITTSLRRLPFQKSEAAILMFISQHLHWILWMFKDNAQNNRRCKQKLSWRHDHVIRNARAFPPTPSTNTQLLANMTINGKWRIFRRRIIEVLLYITWKKVYQHFFLPIK